MFRTRLASRKKEGERLGKRKVKGNENLRPRAVKILPDQRSFLSTTGTKLLTTTLFKIDAEKVEL